MANICEPPFKQVNQELEKLGKELISEWALPASRNWRIKPLKGLIDVPNELAMCGAMRDMFAPDRYFKWRLGKSRF